MMTPLADRSVNRQSRIPIVGFEPRSRVNNENVPPASNVSRLLAPTKSSVARSRSPSPSPIPLPIVPRTAPTTPGRGRLSAVTSDDSLNASFARRQLLRRPSATSLVSDSSFDAPRPPIKSARRTDRQSRPSSPVTKMEDIQSQLPGARTKVPNKSPLKTPNTPQNEEWTALTNKRPATRRGSATPSRTPSTKRISSSKLPRSSVHNSPAIVSPVLDSLTTRCSSPYFVSPISSLKVPNETDNATVSNDPNGHRPPRSSSLQTPESQHDVGLGLDVSTAEGPVTENQEHKYLPAVHSFSRPRAHQTDRSPASVVFLAVPQHLVRADSQKLVASTKPKIVRSSPSLTSRSPVADEVLTFAGRRLGNSTDLAALDHGIARSSKCKDCSTKTSPLKKTNLALQDLPPRVLSLSEQTKLSPIRLPFGDKESASDDVFEYSRVKQLSGSLLSSSFVGSTLSISGEADHLILGDEGARTPSFISQTSLIAPADNEFDLPSPSENGFHVSWPADFGFNKTDGPNSPTVQSSPSVRPKTFSRISEESEQSVAEPNIESFDRYYDLESEVMPVKDDTGVNECRREDITTTLSILEGTPTKADVSLSAVSEPVKPRLGTTRLPQTTSKDGAQDTVHTRNDRLPSYMLPTPASEARKNSIIPPTDVRRTSASTPNLNTRRASQTTKLPATPGIDKDRVLPSGRRTPVSELCGTGRSGRATPTSAIPRSTTPIARPSTGSQLPGQTATTPKPNSKTEANQRVSIGHIRISRQSPQPIETSRDGTFPPTRPRSESKGKSVLNNLKGLFTNKRDVPSTPSSSSRRFSIGSRKSISVEADIPDVPAVPAMPDMPAVPAVSILPEARRKSTTKSILVKKTAAEEVQSSKTESSKEPSISSRPRRKSTIKDIPTKRDAAEEEGIPLRRKASKHKVAATEASQEADSETEKRDTVMLMEMGLTLRQEASKEDDLVRKERMTSFAQVMLDTVTNAVEAERNMYAAMQAAEQAKMSYIMTQQSVQEMNKLVSTSRRLPLFKRKKRSDNVV